MSYRIEGPFFLALSLIVILLTPIGGVIMMVLSLVITAIGFGSQTPGAKPGYCAVLGHDWRRDLQGFGGARVCRNCLKGAQVNYGGYAPGYAPGHAVYSQPAHTMPAPGYAPGYAAPYAAPGPPPAPAAPRYASLVKPTPDAYCKQCGLGVDATAADCPHCGRRAR